MPHSLLLARYRQHMALVFAGIFLVLALVLTGLSIHALANGLLGRIAIVETLVKAINLAVIALAMFELGMVVSREYRETASEAGLTSLRRTVTHFVGIVCIALVLEGLLMVIKYSQLELAGNLTYPVAIIASAALLLTALGLFLRFTENLDARFFSPLCQDRRTDRAALAGTRGELGLTRQRPKTRHGKP